jgi:DNA-binding winged helix-turn-helix (wHTH) protein/TolB-like protein
MGARVRFDGFTFDRASGELTRDGRKVRLQRQPSRLLELLLSRAGDVVTRDEIRQALWGDDTHVDFERSLNFCVAKLRAALRDDAASPRFVETVPTRGYRFLAEPSPVEVPAPAVPDLPTGARPMGRRIGWALAAGAAVLLVAFAGWQVGSSGEPPGIPKLVVVPFQNETGDAGFDRVAKGVSDAAVARLAAPERQAHLLVIGNATGLRFSFRPSDMRAMGQSLGARYLLLGQLKKDDRALRVVAHLIRVRDQTHLWAKTYDTASLDLSGQGTIAEAIALAVTDELVKQSAAQAVTR